MTGHLRIIGLTALIGCLALGTGCTTRSPTAAFCVKARHVDAANVDDEDVDRMLTVIEDLRSSAPPAIAGDLTTIIKTLKLSTSEPAPLRARNEKTVDGAFDRVQAYLKKNCHIDIDN